MMTSYVALLRAVNVGGTGKLPMGELKGMAQACGFTNARTYIASGNLVFDSGLGEAAVKAKLEAALEAYAGKPVGVIVRTAEEMAAAVKADPFPDAPRNRVVCIFLDAAPPAGFEAEVKRLGDDEELRAVGREIFVRYGDGMGDSKLLIPAAKTGTGRNMNTVAKLAQMAAGK